MVAKTRKTGKYHVSKHASGLWKKTIKGQVYYFKTKEQARRELDAIYAQLEGQSECDLHLLTVRDAINAYLTSFEQAIGTPGRTSQRFVSLKRILPEAGQQIGLDKHLARLIPADLERYKSWAINKFAVTTAQTHFRSIKACFNWCYNQGYLDKPVRAANLTIPRSEIRRHRNSKKRTYTAAEAAKILEHAKPHIELAVLLALYAGYLPDDIRTATTKQLDDDYLSYHRSKTGSIRACYLPSRALELIDFFAPYRRHTEALLPTRTGHQRSSKSTSLTDSLKRLCEKLSIDPSPCMEGFRKVCRTVTGGCDPEASRVITGHQHDAIAEVYLDNTLIGRDRLIACRDAMTAWIESGRQEAGQ